MSEVNPEKPARLAITGATGGMGRACSLLAGERGHGLLAADLDAGKLRALGDEFPAGGAAFTHRVLDVRDAGDIESFAAAAAADGIDGLVHTVGLSPQMADWRTIIEVDLVGTVALLEAVRPALDPGGCALCIASMSAHMVPDDPAIDTLFSQPLAPGFGAELDALHEANPAIGHPGLAYAYSKKALKDYVANNAYRWGQEGKRLVSLSPGLIDTDMGRLENDAMENFDEMQAHIALTRLGQPGDIASAALFLVSREAGYITGCDLLVDGGFIARFAEQQRAAGQ